jgi:hypothetical protein
MKQYGLILADNGSAMFVTGAPDNRWNNDNLGQLKTLTAADFEVVQLGTVYTPANVPTGPSPSVTSFTASPSTVNAGTPVTLSWSVTRAIYNIISPIVGPVRVSSVTVTPTATTTFVLYSTNEDGRTTANRHCELSGR